MSTLLRMIYNRNQELINSTPDLLDLYEYISSGRLTREEVQMFRTELEAYRPRGGDNDIEEKVGDLPLRETFLNWLASQTNIMSQELLRNLDSDELNALIDGEIQSGKSFAQVSIIAYSALVKKQSTIWVLRNSVGDRQQAIGNIRYRFGRDSSMNSRGWMCHAIRQGVRPETEPFLKFVICDKSNATEIQEALSRGTDEPRVIVTLGNNSQMKLLQSYIRRVGDVNYNLVVDEGDELGPNDNTKLPKKKETFEILKEKAANICMVTATSLNILFGGDLPQNQVYTIEPQPNYVGIPDLRWEELKDETPQTRRNTSITDDTDLVTFYRDMGQRPVYEPIDTRTGQKFRHPVLVLHKSSKLVCHHQQFVNRYCDTTWLVISYDGEGVRVGFNSLPIQDKIVRLSDGKRISPTPPQTQGDRFMEYKGLHIGDVLEHFRKLDPNAETYTHIAIIAGVLADRGINFCSNNYSYEVHQWHITDMYFKSPRSADCTALIQSMRPCGNYNDDLIPTIYTNAHNRVSILTKYGLQGRIITEAKEDGGDRPIRDYSYGVMTYKKSEWTGVHRATKRHRLKKGQMTIIDDLKEEKIEDDREWGLRELAKNLTRAIQGGRETIVLRILRFFKNSVEGGLENGLTTRHDIIQGCDNSNIGSNYYTKWDKKHGQYKILVKVGNQYRINPELVENMSSLMNQL